MKSDAYHVPEYISSCSDESLVSHRLLDLEETICSGLTICLIDSSLMHNFIDWKMLDRLGLQATVGEILEIILADGSKITVDKVCHIEI